MATYVVWYLGVAAYAGAPFSVPRHPSVDTAIAAAELMEQVQWLSDESVGAARGQGEVRTAVIDALGDVLISD